MTEPTADELTDGQVAAIVAASDEAHMLHAELWARNPSVSSARELADEKAAATGLVRSAFVAAGLSELRAGRAVTVWLIDRTPGGDRLDPRECIRIADAGTWREPGDPAGGLGSA